jgi:hypothetical protein
VGDLVALADAAHVGAAGLALGSAIRFITTQDTRVRGDTHDDILMEPAIDGQLSTDMITAMSRRPSAPDGYVGDSKSMWSLELALARARLDAAYDAHALAEFDLFITTALAMLPPKHPTVARAGYFAEAQLNKTHNTRSLDGLP